jgi:hypothetical protein
MEGIVRVALSAVLGVLLFAPPAAAQEPHRSRHTWLRRITLAGACAASFWDLQTTRLGISQGARETNPLFTDAQGRPRWGRMIGFKAGACAASVVAEEHFARRGSSGTFWTAMNGISAGSFAAIAIRNRQIAGQPAPADKPALIAFRPVANSVLNLTGPAAWATIRPDVGQLPQDRRGVRK